MHAGVQFEMHRELLDAAPAQDFVQGAQGEQVRDAGLEVIVDDLIKEIRPGSEHQDRKADTGLAEFDALHGQGDGQVVGARVLHHPRELDGTVPVGVGLDEHEQAGFPVQFRAEIPVIVQTRREAEFQPRKIVLPIRHFP